MKRRHLFQASLGLGLLGAAGLAVGRLGGVAIAAPQRQADALHWQTRPLLGLGTTLSLRVAHRDPALAERALDGAVATIRHVEAQMSLLIRTARSAV